MNVAETILNQLGGNKFIVMTGSKHFASDGNSLMMNLARNITSANRLKITLNSLDTYDMEFTRYTAPKFNTKTGVFKGESIFKITAVEGVYCDQLRKVFTNVTGLHTSLFKEG